MKIGNVLYIYSLLIYACKISNKVEQCLIIMMQILLITKSTLGFNKNLFNKRKIYK